MGVSVARAGGVAMEDWRSKAEENMANSDALALFDDGSV